jgi:hypothetical protein
MFKRMGGKTSFTRGAGSDYPLLPLLELLRYARTFFPTKKERRTMKTLTETEERNLTLAERKALMPYELVTADGKGIGVFVASEMTVSKCPNCGFVSPVQKFDDTLPPFTTRHP